MNVVSVCVDSSFDKFEEWGIPYRDPSLYVLDYRADGVSDVGNS